MDFSCSSINQVSQVVGLPDMSSSASDQWILTLHDDSSRFIKLFIDTPRIQNYNLLYEIDVYQQLLSKLQCPFFMEYKGVGSKCSFERIMSMFHESDMQKVKRNIYYLYCQNIYKKTPLHSMERTFLELVRHRPTLMQDVTYEQQRIIDRATVFTQLRYTFLVLPTIRTQTLKSQMSYFIRHIAQNQYEIIYDFITIWFQITYLCYIMDKCRMMHNDFHSYNIVIEKKDIQFEFDINRTYRFFARYKVTLYDFDLSYVECIGINKYTEKKEGVFNEFIPFGDYNSILRDCSEHIFTDLLHTLYGDYISIFTKLESYLTNRDGVPEIRIVYNERDITRINIHMILHQFDSMDDEEEGMEYVDHLTKIRIFTTFTAPDESIRSSLYQLMRMCKELRYIYDRRIIEPFMKQLYEYMDRNDI